MCVYTHTQTYIDRIYIYIIYMYVYVYIYMCIYNMLAKMR